MKNNRKCSKCESIDLAIRFYKGGTGFRIIRNYNEQPMYDDCELAKLVDKRVGDYLFNAEKDVLVCHCRICQYNWFEVPADKILANNIKGTELKIGPCYET